MTPPACSPIRPRRGVELALALALAATACSPQKAWTKTLDDVHSWLAAGGMLAEQWTAGRIPRRDALKTLAVGAKALDADRRRLADQRGIAEPARSTAADIAARGASALRRMRAAVDADDTGVVAALRGDLAALARMTVILRAQSTSSP
jgi:hypothetical protein